MKLTSSYKVKINKTGFEKTLIILALKKLPVK